MSALSLSLRCAVVAAALGALVPVAAVEPGMGDPGPYRTPALMGENVGPRSVYPAECDLRVGFGLTRAPQIRERLSSGGRDVDYDWNAHRRSGYALTIGVVAGVHHFHHAGRLLLGGEASYQYFNTTPVSFTVATGPATNTRTDLKTDWQTVGLDAMAGYGSEPLDTAFGLFHVELLGVIGGGAVAASSTEALPGGENVRRRGAGGYVTYGPRLGAYLTHGDYQFGARLDWQWTTGQARVNYPGGDHSTLTAVRGGYVVEGEIGYRF
jgi:hypothetical protein